MSDTPETGSTLPSDTAHDTPLRAGGPTLSLGEAVRYTGAARSTLQRRLHSGAIAGAERTAGGGWRIPISGLIAAGLAPRSTPPDPEPTPVPSPPAHPRETELSEELARVRAELATERAVREAVERHLADLRAALEAMSRALPPAPVTDAPAEPVSPRRRRWFGRNG